MLSEKLIFGKSNNVLEEIRLWKKHSDIPIWIWGTGSVAVGVYKNLLENEIKVNGFLYDTDSVVIDPRIEKEKESILRFNDVVSKYSQIALIIGHSKYELIEKMQRYQAVIKIWALTGIIRVGIKLDEAFIRNNLDKYEYTYSKLEDEQSKLNMISFLNAHLTSDASNIIDNFNMSMTFFDNDVFEYSNDEVYCDCGAYDGKSIQEFIKVVDNKYDSIYAVEVMNNMYRELKQKFTDKRINIINIGLSDHNGTDSFSFDSQSTCLAENGTQVDVCTIDDIVGNKNISLIKIAIGNSIDKILFGAKRTISRNLPKIVIMAGVDKNALIDYIPLIENICGSNKYKYYLRYTNATADCLCLFIKQK